MNKLARYLKERENVDSIECEHGFATYSIDGAECYIQDIWVDAEYRQLNIASQLADQIVEIAKSQGCIYLLGSVCPGAIGADTSIKVLQGYGMKLLCIKGELIFFDKLIGV